MGHNMYIEGGKLHLVSKTFNCGMILLPFLLPTVYSLRAECSSWTYYTLDSDHRNVAAPEDSTPCGDNWWCTDTSGYDNTAPDWAMGGVWGDQPSWYRVVPPAGSKLLTEPAGEKRCGTMASGRELQTAVTILSTSWRRPLPGTLDTAPLIEGPMPAM